MNLNNKVAGANSIAVGSLISINHDNCICLGDGLETHEDNQLIIGSKENNVSITMERGDARMAKKIIEAILEHVL